MVATTETFCWGTTLVEVNSGGEVVTFALSADSDLANEETVGPTSGAFHACIRGRGYRGFPEGSIFCARLNDQGQLGDGTTTARREMLEPFVTADPMMPPALPVMRGVTAGLRHTCGWSETTVWCWGSNADGQVGAASADACSLGACSLRPIQVPLPVTVVTMSAGDRHTCVLTDEGAIWCWGANDRGQLGRGSPGAASQNPMPVPDGRTFTALAAGGAHTCGVRLDGSIYCWGANGSGQLGDGTIEDRAVPTRVVEGS